MLHEIQNVQEKAVCLFSREQVDIALDQMAQAISTKLAESNPLILCVINGGIIVTGQLLPRLDFALTLDSVRASRYGHNTTGSNLNWLYQPTTDMHNRTVLIVDDILDEGITLAAIIDWCRQQGASEVYSAVLLDKQLGRAKPIQADFVGLEVENHYLYGFGLDYKTYLRNANGIYACKDVS